MEPPRRSGPARALHGLILPALALLTAFIVGAFVIVLTDFELLALWASDPGAAIGASWASIAATYGALLRGSIGDPGGSSRRSCRSTAMR